MAIIERSYVKKARRRNVLFGWICAEMYTFQGGKQHIFADIAACYMKCAIFHKIIRYISIIYLSECDIWHMLCVKKLHTAIKSLWG